MKIGFSTKNLDFDKNLGQKIFLFTLIIRSKSKCSSVKKRKSRFRYHSMFTFIPVAVEVSRRKYHNRLLLPLTLQELNYYIHSMETWQASVIKAIKAIRSSKKGRANSPHYKFIRRSSSQSLMRRWTTTWKHHVNWE